LGQPKSDGREAPAARMTLGEGYAGIYGLVHDLGTYGREFANIHGFEYSTFRAKIW
jgi:hypothetical protein